MNPFTLISARVRLWLYGVAGFSGLGLGAVTAYCEAVGTPRPAWVVGASAALAVLSAPLFALAASNVAPQVTVVADPPRKVTVEPLGDPIVSSEGVDFPSDAHYEPKHDVD